MLVSIVILNYNGSKTLKKCLDSVFKLDFPSHAYEVIVVDNCSQDKSLEIIKRYKRVKLVKNKKNLGFAEGNNIGIKKSRGKYIVLFNNDLVVDKKWLKILVPEMEKNKDIGAIGGKIYCGSGIWFSGAKTYFGGFVNHKYLGEKGGESNYIVGAAVMFRRSCLDKTGLFDKKFYLYEEDTDLCWRIRKEGYKVVYNPRAISWHLINNSRVSSHQEYYEQRNRVYLYAKRYKYLKIGFLILDLVIFFPLFWVIRVSKNPARLKFWRETLRARIDSLIMSLKSKSCGHGLLQP